MMWVALVYFFNLFVSVFNFLILARIILSWIGPNFDHPLAQFIIDATEPILMPVRKFLPRGGLVDWAPLATIIGLQFLQQLVNYLISRI